MHVPPALARMIAAKSFDAEYVYDVQLGEAEDAVIWNYAIKTEATIVTKDEDFIVLANFRPNSPRHCLDSFR